MDRDDLRFYLFYFFLIVLVGGFVFYAAKTRIDREAITGTVLLEAPLRTDESWDHNCVLIKNEDIVGVLRVTWRVRTKVLVGNCYRFSQSFFSNVYNEVEPCE